MGKIAPGVVAALTFAGITWAGPLAADVARPIRFWATVVDYGAHPGELANRSTPWLPHAPVDTPLSGWTCTMEPIVTAAIGGAQQAALVDCVSAAGTVSVGAMCPFQSDRVSDDNIVSFTDVARRAVDLAVHCSNSTPQEAPPPRSRAR